MRRVVVLPAFVRPLTIHVRWYSGIRRVPVVRILPPFGGLPARIELGTHALQCLFEVVRAGLRRLENGPESAELLMELSLGSFHTLDPSRKCVTLATG